MIICGRSQNPYLHETDFRAPADDHAFESVFNPYIEQQSGEGCRCGGGCPSPAIGGFGGPPP
ncbi:hypothetical protein DPMN_095053 [Dreissena polymorpha]|uniref:Uncharacterized protein n=1 Tax=Dreissena polymorpha TaxID=45954 RepID=A0A9D4R3F2_DREPO|nr:hypothetical protein DPMN_095053 [Dreissena polymorpha]